MTISVHYFGVLKELRGVVSESVDLPEESTVAGLIAAVGLPESPMWKRIAVGVNAEFSGRGTVLRPGDTVDLMPPVSGGSR